MASRGRIGWGHALTGLAVLVRRAAVLLAAVALAVLALTAMAPPARGVDPLWVLAVPAATFLGTRLIAVGLAALGWLVFPDGHRRMLAELASGGPVAGRDRPVS